MARKRSRPSSRSLLGKVAEKFGERDADYPRDADEIGVGRGRFTLDPRGDRTRRHVQDPGELELREPPPREPCEDPATELGLDGTHRTTVKRQCNVDQEICVDLNDSAVTPSETLGVTTVRPRGPLDDVDDAWREAVDRKLEAGNLDRCELARLVRVSPSAITHLLRRSTSKPPGPRQSRIAREVARVLSIPLPRDVAHEATDIVAIFRELQSIDPSTFSAIYTLAMSAINAKRRTPITHLPLTDTEKTLLNARQELAVRKGQDGSEGQTEGSDRGPTRRRRR